MKVKRLFVVSLFITLFFTACQETPAPGPTSVPAIETSYPAPPTEVPNEAYPPPVPPSEAAPETETQEQAAEAERLAQITAIKAAVIPETVQQFQDAASAYTIQVLRYACVPPPGSDFEIALEELVVSMPDGETFVADQQLLNCGGLGAFGYNGLFWSPDGRYFYFTEAREGVPDGGPCGLWLPWLYRVNLFDRTTEQLPGNGPRTADDRHLVLWDGADFVLWDLNGTEITRSAPPTSGYYLFSAAIGPDGSRLLYVLRSDCFLPEADSLVGLLDLVTFEHTVVLEAGPNGFTEANWQNENEAVLIDSNGKAFQVNLNTGEVKPQE